MNYKIAVMSGSLSLFQMFSDIDPNISSKPPKEELLKTLKRARLRIALGAMESRHMPICFALMDILEPKTKNISWDSIQSHPDFKSVFYLLSWLQLALQDYTADTNWRMICFDDPITPRLQWIHWMINQVNDKGHLPDKTMFNKFRAMFESKRYPFPTRV